jgi:hypothetical protein
VKLEFVPIAKGDRPFQIGDVVRVKRTAPFFASELITVDAIEAFDNGVWMRGVWYNNEAAIFRHWWFRNDYLYKEEL